MQISMLQLIFLGIPEGISVLTLIFVLAGAKISWKQIIVLGSGLALSAFLLRLLPITFGVHTIVYIGILIFATKEYTQIDVIPAIIYSLVTMLALIVSETLTSAGLMHLLKITPEMLSENILIHMLVFYPHVLILFGLAILLRKLKRKGNYELFKN